MLLEHVVGQALVEHGVGVGLALRLDLLRLGLGLGDLLLVERLLLVDLGGLRLRVLLGDGLAVAHVLHADLLDGQADLPPLRRQHILHRLRVLASVGEHRQGVEPAGLFAGH